jgi:hypothetical protein
MRIYLDICTFNRPFDDQNQLKLKIIKIDLMINAMRFMPGKNSKNNVH